MCLPKQTCPKSDILDNLDSSVQIENINNVYYYNDSEWLAVDLTWVQYTCVHHEGILVGKNERTCLNGKWTNKNPYCMHGMIEINILKRCNLIHFITWNEFTLKNRAEFWIIHNQYHHCNLDRIDHNFFADCLRFDS